MMIGEKVVAELLKCFGRYSKTFSYVIQIPEKPNKKIPICSMFKIFNRNNSERI